MLDIGKRFLLNNNNTTAFSDCTIMIYTYYIYTTILIWEDCVRIPQRQFIQIHYFIVFTAVPMYF